MRFMLDANALILLLAGHERLVSRASNCGLDDLCVSVISFAEVAHGAASGKPPALDVLRRMQARIPVLPFDEDAALQYARMPFARHRFDRLIAAHALALKLTLITGNARDFRAIPDLRIEDWTK